MKLLKIKEFFKKILIVILMIFSLECLNSRPVQADTDGVGGNLVEPVLSLVTSMGDGVNNFLHKYVMGQEKSYIRVDMSSTLWDKAKKILVPLVVGIITFLAVAITGGLAAIVAAGTAISAIAEMGIGAIIIAGSATAVKAGLTAGVLFGIWYDNTCFPDDLVLPTYSMSTEEIFQGKILLFDVDFFNPVNDIYLKTKAGKTYIVKNYTDEQLTQFATNDGGVEGYFYKDGSKEIQTSKQNTAYEIQSVVSKWYYSLRNICLVLMLSVLLYTAIRMMTSTIASDKAKYRQLLIDWIVGMSLLFFLHYIMAFSVTLVKQFTKIIDTSFEDTVYTVTMEDDEAQKLSKKLTDLGYGEDAAESMIQEGEVNGKKVKLITWPTNLMGSLRVKAEMSMGDADFVGYSISYIVLTIYTVFFAITYLKRVLYLAFLTLISPFVALTYPIDKMNDGQAQGFNKWLKEYIFNLLIQPLHLLLYTVLVSSAIKFAGLNTLYTLVAIGFMIPAEKILRSLFGFEKAATPPSLAGAAAGAGLISHGMRALLGKAPGFVGGNKQIPSGNGQGPSGGDGNGKIKYGNENFDAISNMLGSSSEENTNTRTENENPRTQDFDFSGNNDRTFNGVTGDPNAEPSLNLDPFGEYGNTQNSNEDGRVNMADFDQNEENEQNNTNDTDRYEDIRDNQYNRTFDGVRGNPNAEPSLNLDPFRNIDSQQQNSDESGRIHTVDNSQPEQLAENDNENQDDNFWSKDRHLSDLGNTRPVQAVRNGVRSGVNSATSFAKRKLSKPAGAVRKVGRGIDRTLNKYTPNMYRAAKGTARATGVIAKSAAKGTIRTAAGLTSSAIKAAPKAVAGAAVGATAGTIGLAAGISTGELKNAASFAGGGLAAGYISGSKTVERVGNSEMAASIQKTMTEDVPKAYMGEERYEQRQLEQRRKEWKRNQEHQEQLKKLVGEQASKDMMKNGEVDEYLKQNITDIESMAAMHRMQEQNIAKDAKHAISIHKYAQRTGDLKTMKGDDKKKWANTFSEEFETKGGRNKEDAKRAGNSTMDLIEKYQGIKRSL